MGVLSEVFRVKAKKNRSWHPVYSFAVFGSLPGDYLAKKITQLIANKVFSTG